MGAGKAAANALSFRSMSDDYLQRILKAKVYDVAIESPLEEAARLSRRLGNRVLLKRETCSRSFPSNCVVPITRSRTSRPRWPSAASSAPPRANHAQGLLWQLSTGGYRP